MPEFDSNSDGETITIHELLERNANAALELQSDDGSFPPGRNYTYDEPETPVRTTSHWLTTIAEVYDITADERYRKAAEAAVDYLLTDDLRPNGYTYYCRNAPGKDNCNGLVGQAAPIRALTHAGIILQREDAIAEAAEVFALHPFDEQLGLWERVEIDGEKLSFDRTLNHQILFAAGSRKLASESKLVRGQIETFLDQLANNMRLHPDGVIKHYVRPSPMDSLRAFFRGVRHWQLLLNEVVFHYYSRSEKRRQKEVGYQPVNLRGLAQIRKQFPNHPIWDQNKIKKVLQILDTERYEQGDYGSIVPGIEFAWASYGLSKDTDKMKIYLQEEFTQKLDTETYQLESNHVGDIDQSSVISFLVGLPNTEVSFNN